MVQVQFEGCEQGHGLYSLLARAIHANAQMRRFFVLTYRVKSVGLSSVRRRKILLPFMDGEGRTRYEIIRRRSKDRLVRTKLGCLGEEVVPRRFRTEVTNVTLG